MALRRNRPESSDSEADEETVLEIPKTGRQPYDPVVERHSPTPPRLNTRPPQHRPAPPRDPAPAAAGEQGRLIVGAGVRIKGEIGSCDTLVVFGSVESEIEAAALEVAETGTVVGDAEVGTAEVHGRFDGSLKVRDRLVIHERGRVSGTIRYGGLRIADGGQISGDVEAAGPAAESAPRPVKPVPDPDPEPNTADAG